MTGRERTLAALRRQPTGRPAADFWAEDATLNRLFAYLGHSDLERFLDDMRVDIRAFNAREPAPVEIGGGVFQNIWGERFVYRQTEWGPFREDMPGALSGAGSLDEIAAFPWPCNDLLDYSALYENCRLAREKGLAVRYGFADVWQRPSLVRGMEKFLADMIENPENARYLSKVFTDFYAEDFKRAWEASRGQIDIFFAISDVGTQTGPMISPSMFEEFVAPYLKELADLVHGFGAALMYHSCGDVSAFLPSIIACGADILNPIQPAGPNMSPERLKKYADRLCFHGGIDVQRLLPSGTAGEIRAEARRYAEILGPGYIMCSAHLLQPDTPPENIAALYEAFDR